MVKRLYNRLPQLLRPPFAAVFGVAEQLRPGLARLLRGENPLPFSLKSQDRGMAWWSDVVDWVGGYPFEVARPEGIFNFYRARGFIHKG